MKLTLGHNEIIQGICLFLESQGMNAFNPKTVAATFTQSRADRSLTVELDNDPQPTEDKPKSPAKPEAPAATAQASATKGGENAAAQAEPMSPVETGGEAAPGVIGTNEIAKARAEQDAAGTAESAPTEDKPEVQTKAEEPAAENLFG